MRINLMKSINNIIPWNVINKNYLSEALKDFYKKILSLNKDEYKNYIKNIYEEIIFSTDDNTEQNQNNG
jgi:hypothetical protein